VQHEALNDELDHQRLKRQEEDKKPKQPGEEVGGHKNSSQLSAISLQSCCVSEFTPGIGPSVR
jgi:hypothetical protein